MESGSVPTDHQWLESGLCVPLDPIEQVIDLFPSLVSEPFNGVWLGTQDSKSLENTKDGSGDHDSKLVEGFQGKPEPKSTGKKSGADSPGKNSGAPEAVEMKSWLNHYLNKGFCCKKGRSKRAMKQQKVIYKRNKEEVIQVQRRCSHCQAQKTPLWRMGPMGPRTLCNACGVRYKTGRLLPEYRPAASPTFNKFKHSNFHKKILRKRQGCVVH